MDDVTAQDPINFMNF